jgi:hypothetical protein
MRAPRPRFAVVWLALATLLLASACSAGSATDFCVLAQPIFISRADQLTDETVRQLLAHNETWEAICHARQG